MRLQQKDVFWKENEGFHLETQGRVKTGISSFGFVVSINRNDAFSFMNLFPVRSRRPSKSCNVDRKPRIGKCFCLLLSIYPIFILFEAQYYARLSRTEKMSFYNNEVIQLTELIPTEINRTRLNSNATKDPLYIKLKYTSDKGTQSLVNIFERLYFNFDILDCDRDVTLLQPRETKERFFVAVNLKDNEDIMPNFIVQMLTLVSLFDEDRIRISIYESGSVDSTPQWLIFLGKLLDVVGVRHKIVPYGNLVRQRKVDRIPFLSSVRNAAMEPLQEWQDTWIATKVVFINDVFFCAQHVLRLARHDADLACGMDFTHCVPCLKVSTQLQLMKADLLTNYKFSASQTKWIMKSGYFRSWWRKRIKHDTKRLKDLGAPMAFYDKWVSHDIQGNSFLNPAPYTKDLETIESFQKGRPVYVYSCWNGLVAINPEPFYRSICLFQALQNVVS